MKNKLPVLYSNDTCPYAFRARMALHYSEIEVEHREILFDDKPPSMLLASPKGTVPTLVLDNGDVIDESWDVVRWALEQHDPDDLARQRKLPEGLSEQNEIAGIIEEIDGEFSEHVYYYQYHDEYSERDRLLDRDQASAVAIIFEQRLARNQYLLSDTISVADFMLFPFMRNFASVQPSWFSDTFPASQEWLDRLENTLLVEKVLLKHKTWKFQ